MIARFGQKMRSGAASKTIYLVYMTKEEEQNSQAQFNQQGESHSVTEKCYYGIRATRQTERPPSTTP